MNKNNVQEKMKIQNLLPDREEETKPNCASGVRRRITDESISWESMADGCLAALEKRRTNASAVLAEKVKKCRDEFRSWSQSPPTSVVKKATQNSFTELNIQVLNYLAGVR